MGTSHGRAVVVGVDASDSARHSVGWAAELASDTGRPVRLVHVAATPPGDGMLPAWLRELVDTAERQGADPVEAELVEGGVADVLLERSGPDGYLVVGSYGEGVQGGMLAGTLALALLARADCAVAVVRGAAPGLPPPRTGPVVVGVNDAPSADTVLERAAEVAAAHGAHVLAVHTWSDIVATAGGHSVRRSASHGTELAADAAVALEARVARCRERRPGVVIESRVVGDTALRALLDQAADARAVVVGRWRGPETGGMLGSTSRGLVEFAPCPVVVV
ncbi:MAG TPA: universal stress protein [Pseudonocardia sp.]|nr:universal stress protein [Pseudonocardia sp.]